MPLTRSATSGPPPSIWAWPATMLSRPVAVP